MIASIRGFVIGLLVWLTCFALIYALPVKASQMGWSDAGTVTAIVLVGFVAVRSLASRYCRHDHERTNALVVFALAMFVGIVVPITDIRNTKAFYTWSVQGGGRKSPQFGWLIAANVENMVLSHLLGLAALVFVVWLLARRYRTSLEKITLPAKVVRLERVDIVLGALAFLSGLYFAVQQLTSVADWLAYTLAAFLMCFVFRWLRLRKIAVEQALPPEAAPLPPGYMAALGTAAGWLVAIALLWELVGENHLGLLVGMALLLAIIGLLTPWFCWQVRHRQPMAAAPRSLLLSRYSCATGLGAGAALMLAFGGWVCIGIAEAGLKKGNSEWPVVFLGILALKPIYCIATLPAAACYIGALLPFPRGARPTEQILAQARGGAVMAIASGPLVFLALSMALCIVPSILIGKQFEPRVAALVGDEHWYWQSGFYVCSLLGLAAGGAFLWGGEAALHCGVLWLMRKLRKHKITRTGLVESLRGQSDI